MRLGRTLLPVHVAQLEALPGTGPVLARTIVDRQPYATVYELLKAPGIDSPMLARFKEQLTIQHEGTMENRLARPEKL
ncbi:MAG: ComEA family DNA-binding protein [Anaerolineae bacterium]